MNLHHQFSRSIQNEDEPERFLALTARYELFLCAVLALVIGFLIPLVLAGALS